MKNLYSLVLLLVCMLSAMPSVMAQQLGCTDPNAANFDPNATDDDGSCYYIYYGCTDPNATNYDPNATDDDGSCYYIYYGCTDPNAVNFDPSANADDGSCYYYYYGCTDPNAVNFDPSANADDGSCYFEIYGCTNPGADNYDPYATVDDGSCYITGTSGCTDPNAVNYDPWANYEDGSCYYYIYGCTDSNAINYDASANADDGTCLLHYDCYGELNGNALLDDCGQCTGGSTGMDPCIVIGLNNALSAHQALHIYPNPNTGRFAISAFLDLGELVAVQLVDIAGRVVYQQPWSASKGVVLVVDASLENGMYLLHVTTENGKLFSSSIIITTN